MIISPGQGLYSGFYKFVRSLGWAYKRGDLYPGGKGLLNGIKKTFRNELIRNKLKLIKNMQQYTRGAEVFVWSVLIMEKYPLHTNV